MTDSDSEEVALYPEGCLPIHGDLSSEEMIERIMLLLRKLKTCPSGSEDWNYIFLFDRLSLFLMKNELLTVRLLASNCLSRLYHMSQEIKDRLNHRNSSEVYKIFSLIINLFEFYDGNKYFERLIRSMTITQFLTELHAKLHSSAKKDAYDLFIRTVLSTLYKKEGFRGSSHSLLALMVSFINKCECHSHVGVRQILKHLRVKKYPLVKYFVKQLIVRCESVLRTPIIEILCQKLEDDQFIEGTSSGKEFKLLYVLHGICPNTVSSIWIQLEPFLKKPPESRGKWMSFSLLARIFSDEHSRFAQDYPNIWYLFMNCIKEGYGRHIMAKYVCCFLVYHPELRSTVYKLTKEIISDVNSEIVLRTIRSIWKAVVFDINILRDGVLEEILKERVLDTNELIQGEACRTLGKIYQIMTYRNSDAEFMSHAKDISNTLMKLYKTPYDQSTHMKILDEVIVEYLIPNELPRKERVMKLLQLWCMFDEESRVHFHWYLEFHSRARNIIRELLNLQGGQEAIECKRKILIGRLCLTLGYGEEKLIILDKLAGALTTNVTLRSMLESCVNVSETCDHYKMIRDQLSEILTFERNIEEELKAENEKSEEYAAVKIVKEIFNKIANFLVDGEAVKLLMEVVMSCRDEDNDTVEILKTDKETMLNVGPKLVYEYYRIMPQWAFEESSFKKLTDFLSLSTDNIAIVLKIFDTISSYKPLGEVYHDVVSRLLLPLWMACAKQGSVEVAKYATRCICKHVTQNEKDAFDEIKKDFIEVISGPDVPLTGIAAFGHLVVHMPKFEEESIRELLRSYMKVFHKIFNGEPDEPSFYTWYKKEELPYDTRLKVEALKSLTRCVLRYPQKNIFLEMLKLFKDILNDEYDPTKKLSKSTKEWLRLTVGCCFLKLNERPVNGKHLPIPALDFVTVAKLMMDPSKNVQKCFIEKLRSKLIQWNQERFGFSPIFISYFALGGVELDPEIQELMKEALDQCIKDKRNQAWKACNILNVCYDEKELLKKKPNAFPEYCVHVAVVLLADHLYHRITDINYVIQIHDCLKFLLDALLNPKNGTFGCCSPQYYDGLFNYVRRCSNVMEPSNADLNKKIRIVCEIGEIYILGIITEQSKKVYPSPVVCPSFLRYEGPDTRDIKVRYLPLHLEEQLIEERYNNNMPTAYRRRRNNFIRSQSASDESHRIPATRRRTYADTSKGKKGSRLTDLSRQGRKQSPRFGYQSMVTEGSRLNFGSEKSPSVSTRQVRERLSFRHEESPSPSTSTGKSRKRMRFGLEETSPWFASGHKEPVRIGKNKKILGPAHEKSPSPSTSTGQTRRGLSYAHEKSPSPSTSTGQTRRRLSHAQEISPVPSTSTGQTRRRLSLAHEISPLPSTSTGQKMKK